MVMLTMKHGDFHKNQWDKGPTTCVIKPHKKYHGFWQKWEDHHTDRKRL